MAQKIVRSVREQRNKPSEPAVWVWSHIKNQAYLWEALCLEVSWVRSQARYSGFSDQGYDRWVEGRSEEDCSVLLDETKQTKAWLEVKDSFMKEAEK